MTAVPVDEDHNSEWMESGITRGEIRVGLFGDTECVAQTSIYGMNHANEMAATYIGNTSHLWEW